jgi:hypothetical protein
MGGAPIGGFARPSDAGPAGFVDYRKGTTWLIMLDARQLVAFGIL